MLLLINNANKSSSKKECLEGYMNAGDIVLTDVDVKAIDTAGAIGFGSLTIKKIATRAAVGAALWIGLYGLMTRSGLSFDY